MDSFDLFAEALWQFYRTGRAALRTERDDGVRGGEDLSWYFTTWREFPSYERAALKLARGRVLDVGCGAGRHSLYLQRRGLRVTAIDSSARAVELAQARGVRDARVAGVCRRLPFRDGEFDTAILFGNNLGICGTPQGFRRMLRELHRVTSARGRILGTTRLPSTTEPVHRRYWLRNTKLGRAVGQVRLRLVFCGKRGAWFDLLLLSPTEVLRLAALEGWELTQVSTEDLEQGYSVVLDKRTSR